MFVSIKEMLDEAYRQKNAVGAFMLWTYDSARAIAEAADELSRPVIYIIGEDGCKYLGGFSNVRKIVELATAGMKIPVALHADHFSSYEAIVGAIEGGFTSVMIDASRYPLEKNIEITSQIVEYASRHKISVEAELGRLPGNEGDIDVPDAEAFQTDPDEARLFVKHTGIDCLAVSIGTVHGAYSSEPKINIPRVKLISEAVGMPLVMHGGSGTPDDKVVEAVENGICKVNIATELVTIMGKTISEVQQTPQFRYRIENLYEPARTACKELVKEKIKLLGRM